MFFDEYNVQKTAFEIEIFGNMLTVAFGLLNASLLNKSITLKKQTNVQCIKYVWYCIKPQLLQNDIVRNNDTLIYFYSEVEIGFHRNLLK